MSIRANAFCLAGLAFLPMAVRAQSTTTAGPLIGVNSTKLVPDDADGAGSRTGFTLGVQLQHGLGGGAFLRTGVQYSMRGAKDEAEGTTATLKLDYVEVPVLLGYEFAKSGAARPFVMAGAQLGLKTKCQIKGESNGVSVTADCDESAGKVSSTDIGLAVGGGVSFLAGSGTISADLRFVKGLQDIAENSDSKNQGFTLAVAYMLPIGPR